jgi:MFS family permease
LKKWLLFLAFGCVGITTEIFFTAISSVVESILNHEAINWRMLGFSYIWMFPIYGLISFLAPIVLGFLSKYPLLLRMFIAAIHI